MIDEVVTVDAGVVQGEQMPMKAVDDGYEIDRILCRRWSSSQTAFSIGGDTNGGRSIGVESTPQAMGSVGFRSGRAK